MNQSLCGFVEMRNKMPEIATARTKNSSLSHCSLVIQINLRMSRRVKK